MAKYELTSRKDGNASVNMRRYVTLFLTNIKLICFIVIVMSLLGVVISYALPKKYMAESRVSIEQNIVSDLVKGIAITPSAEAKMRLLNVYLLSRNILEKVISNLDMDLGITSPMEKEALIQSIRKRVTIAHDEKRGLFTIAFEDKDPILARDFVNTMTRLYIEDSTAEKRKESYDATTFLSDQIKTFQKRIEEAQVAIDTFKSQKGMYLGLNEQLLRQQIKELEHRLEAIRIRKNELKAKTALLSNKAQLTEQLRAKELALQSERATYTDRHPLIQRLLQDIKGLKELIAQEEEASEPTASSEYQGIKVELESLEATERNMNASLEENMKDLRELPSIRTELAELEQRKANEMRIYEQLVGRFGQSEVAKQMELQDKAVSFRVIDAAVTPTIHFFPKRYLFMLGGIMLGFALAGGIILGMEVLRPRIRSTFDLEAYGLSILSKVRQLAPQNMSHRSRTNILALVFTTCVLLLICGAAAVEFFNLPYIEKILASSKRLFLS